MNKIGLILIAHGSRDQRWREPFEKLLADIKSGIRDDCIFLAYMDVASPTLHDAVSGAVKRGIKKLRVLPLFMAGGGHVEYDIPVQVEKVKGAFREVEIELLKPVGEIPEVYSAIRKTAISALS